MWICKLAPTRTEAATTLHEKLLKSKVEHGGKVVEERRKSSGRLFLAPSVTSFETLDAFHEVHQDFSPSLPAEKIILPPVV